MCNDFKVLSTIKISKSKQMQASDKLKNISWKKEVARNMNVDFDSVMKSWGLKNKVQN